MSAVLKKIPNILTISRIILAPIFFVLFIYDYMYSAFICFFIASITDILDGFLARKFNIVSKFGKLYDPLADKILIFLGFTCIMISSNLLMDKSFFISHLVGYILNLHAETVIYLILAILIIRDLMVTALREDKLKKDQIILKTTLIAKIKTIMVFISIHLYILYEICFFLNINSFNDEYSDLLFDGLSLYSWFNPSNVLAVFELFLYLTLILSLWSLISYINQYRKKYI